MAKRVGIFKMLICAALIVPMHSAFAADKGSQFGLLYGLSVPDADNTNMFRMFGVAGEAFIVPQFSAGGYYFQSDKSGEVGGNKFRYGMTGIEAMYHIPAAQGDTFIGLRIGMTKLAQNPSGTDATFSTYHYGLATGYDFYITEHISVGFEGNYIHVLPGRSIVSGTTFEQASFNMINFLISLKLRL